MISFSLAKVCAHSLILPPGGPDGEISASMRYLSQRYSMPFAMAKGTLTDIGTEELAHMEIIAAIIHQLTRNLTMEEIEASGFGPYYIDHTTGIWPQAAGGIPFNACEFQSKGDIIADLVEDMAAEQKARATYDNILRTIHDPEICDPIRFLREREIVHFQRFGETLRNAKENIETKNFYAYNPSFDQPPKSCGCK
ncbi:manganese catalase family protein [Hominifimenecus sp. rT4P-3]|uniref:manganese catalase family protein n=1 Tax=Hominifimenecus sp. rT4P-3 TaxID=3242979 RepID=UPI003DA357D7